MDLQRVAAMVEWKEQTLSRPNWFWDAVSELLQPRRERSSGMTPTGGILSLTGLM